MQYGKTVIWAFENIRLPVEILDRSTTFVVHPSEHVSLTKNNHRIYYLITPWLCHKSTVDGVKLVYRRFANRIVKVFLAGTSSTSDRCYILVVGHHETGLFEISSSDYQRLVYSLLMPTPRSSWAQEGF